MLDALTIYLTTASGLTAIAGAVAVCLLGWVAKRAKDREKHLQLEMLQAKSALPQLEHDARSNSEKVTRLAADLKEASDQTKALSAELTGKHQALTVAEKKVHDLTNELNVLRGISPSVGNEIIDGFDESVLEIGDGKPAAPPSSPPTGNPADLADRLAKAEAVYETLRGALIKRDAQIDELTSRLDAAHSEAEASVANVLESKVQDQQTTIDGLIANLQSLEQEKAMLADMAKRRSQSNHALKEETHDLQTRIPELEADLAERDEVITHREASIKRLLDELDETKAERDGLVTEVHDLANQTATQASELAAQKGRMDKLISELTASERQAASLAAELEDTRSTLADRDATIAARDTESSAAEPGAARNSA